MRWVLGRAHVPCFGGPVPQKPNRCSVEGTLLHALVEGYVHHALQEGAGGFRPRRALLELIAGWAADNAGNPRIDSKVLAGQVRVEEILRAFGEACSHLNIVRRPRASESLGGATGAVFEGPESWLRDPGSKLCGRVDLISSGEIVDFKSGEQQDYHVEQIGFYGALYLAQSGQAPRALRLIYTASDEVRNVPVPGLSELRASLDGMRERAAAAEVRVRSGNLRARPGPARCASCHVRGLCGAYWGSGRGARQGLDESHGPVIDYAPSAWAKMETAALGAYIRDRIGDTGLLLHIPQEVVEKMDGRFDGLGVIAVRPSASADGVRLAFTQGSEVYCGDSL